MASIHLDRYAVLLDALDFDKREEVRWLFAILAVPPDLICLVDGMRRVSAYLSMYRLVWRELLEAGSFPAMTESRLAAAIEVAIETATALFGESERVMGPMVRKDETQRHPLYRYCITVCPIWSTLFNEPRTGTPDHEVAIHRDLQALVMLYTMALYLRLRRPPYLADYDEWARSGRQPELDSGSATSRIRDASYQIRRLSTPEAAPELQAFVGATGDLLSCVHWADVRWPATSPPAETRGTEDVGRLRSESANALRLLHEVYYEPRQRRTGHQSAVHYNVSHRGRPDGYVRLSGDQLTSGAESLDDGSELEHLFLCATTLPNEDGAVDPADRCGIVVLSTPQTPWQRPYARLESLRQVEQVSRRLSASTYERVELTPWQVVRLARGLEEAKGGKSLSTPALVLALTLLSTGRDPEVAPVRFDADAVDEAAQGAIVCSGNGWRLPVHAPAYGDHPQNPEARLMTQVLCLPDFFDTAAIAGSAGIRRLGGNQSIQRLRNELDTWLAQLFSDDVVRARNLDHWLYRRLLDTGKRDVACANFITGRPLAHSRSSIHYTAVSVGRALATYRAALDPLQGAFAATPPQTVAQDSGTYIGACRVPTREAVTRLVAGLASRLRESVGYDRRNALTAYTLAGLHLGTAARPVARRFVHELQYEFGFALLREKGPAYHERPIPLAPDLKEQLRGYYRALRSWGYSPREAFLRWDDDGWPVAPFCPDDFRRHAACAGFHLEPYALRRFVRTELCEQGADGEDVDALMGHWFERLSPHDPWSCYPGHRLARLARGPIAALLQQVGYVVMT